MWKKLGGLIIQYLPQIVEAIIEAQAKSHPNKLVDAVIKAKQAEQQR